MAQPGQDDGAANQSVTISIIQQVRAGRERDFDEFLHGITASASRFPGYGGVQVIRPRGSGRTYRIVLRFDSRSDLERWRDSDERSDWAERGQELADAPPRVANITGTSQDQPLALALTPLEHYVRTSISGIGLLLFGTVVALVMANTPLSDAYNRLWNLELAIGVGDNAIVESLRHWVNDALMALFFFIVGLEIKREMLVGELRYLRQALLPGAAALGGAVVPALMFLLFNAGGDGVHGWGVPLGTDTAFTLGIITLFGSRVPSMLLVFLTAFAILDDILAVLVIAVFYTDSLNWVALGLAMLLVGMMALANRAGVHRWPIYAVLGLGVWLAVFESGVHGTIAGILVAMTVPARAWLNPGDFLLRGRRLIDEFEEGGRRSQNMLSNHTQQEAIRKLEQLCEDVETPMTHFQHRLGPWVNFGVLPLFAFANAGIPIIDGFTDSIGSPVTWGVIAGLVIGKPVGVFLFSWLAVRTNIAGVSGEITWSHIFGVACLGGIGFTMSLFISELAFGENILADDARIGILIGSIVAGVLGYLVLRATLPEPRADVDHPGAEPETAAQDLI